MEEQLCQYEKLSCILPRFLSRICRPVEKFDNKLAKILDDMYDTMIENDGVGLAAPQIGLNLQQVAIVDVDDESGTIEMINPRIIENSWRTNRTRRLFKFS